MDRYARAVLFAIVLAMAGSSGAEPMTIAFAGTVDSATGVFAGQGAAVTGFNVTLCA